MYAIGEIKILESMKISKYSSASGVKNILARSRLRRWKEFLQHLLPKNMIGEKKSKIIGLKTDGVKTIQPQMSSYF